MKEAGKLARFVVLTILILLAASGIGITGTFLPTNKERFQNNEIRTEQIDKKKEDDD
jgi:hypothetical protein